MSLEPLASRTTAVVLALALILPAPSVARAQDNNDSLAQLAKAAKKRDKEASKQLKAVREQMQAAWDKARQADAQNLYEELVMHHNEIRALKAVEDGLESERKVLARVMDAGRGWVPDLRSLQRYGELDRAIQIQRLKAELSRAVRMSRFKIEVAKQQGTKKDVIASVERELAAYGQALEVMQQEETMLDRFFVSLGAPSVSEIQRRHEAAVAADKRRRALQRELEDQQAREFVEKLILSLGIVAALILILKSPTATAAEKDNARERLKELKDRAKTECNLRRGVFFDEGDLGVGTCSK
jgi:hypothetical protein